MTKLELIKMLQEHDSPDDTIVKCYDGSYDGEPIDANAIEINDSDFDNGRGKGLYITYIPTKEDILRDKEIQDRVDKERKEMIINLTPEQKDELKRAWLGYMSSGDVESVFRNIATSLDYDGEPWFDNNKKGNDNNA